MRDVTRKIDTLRTATAQATVRIGATGRQHLAAGTLPKGDPFGVSQAAGMLAAKRTSELIPHCHNLPLDGCEISFETTESGVTITAVTRTVWKTGVEMEALTAASIAALTLYDLLKPVEEDLSIVETKLTEKRGGESQFAKLFQDIKPRFAVLVASDRASEGTYDDVSGAKIRELVSAHGATEAGYKVLPDEQDALAQQLTEWCATGEVDYIFTSGGTGIAPRDVMVEATQRLIDRQLPGIEEAMRGYSQRRKPLAMFTRGIVGVRGKTMIINLPGSPKGVEECLEALLPYVFHAVGELSKGSLPVAKAAAGPAIDHHVRPMGAEAPSPPAPVQAPIVVAAPPPPEQPPTSISNAPLFDPVTGEPITATPAGMPTPKFDPVTGAPIDLTPAVPMVAQAPPPPAPPAPAPPPAQPPTGSHHSLDPGWRGTLYSPAITPEPQPSVPMFDPVTGEPIGYTAQAPTPPPADDATPPAMPSVAPAAKPDDTSMFSMPS